MKKIMIFMLALSFAFSSCEKDDICDGDTPTTPRIVIKFYDINNPTVEKRVTNLKVIGEGMTDGVVFEPTAQGEFKYLANSATISLPLKTNATSSSYRLILNSGSTNAAFVNTDLLKFNYATNEIYVSRACGFKTLFEMSTTTPIEHTDGPTSDTKWIKVVSLQKTNINNENETHLSLFF